MKVAVPTDAKLRIKKKNLTSQLIQAYDDDNAYPQRVINILSASGTASSCSELLKKHLRGRGFSDPKIESFIINHKGETLSEIHNLICEDRSRFKGFALHVGYNMLLEITSITHIPFEMVRLGIPDEMGVVTKIAVHADWWGQTGARRAAPDYYDVFTTDEERILSQIESLKGGFNEWKGHILFFSESGKMQYPFAVGDAVLPDIKSDAGVQLWKNRAVDTGFSASHFFYHHGVFENEDARQEFIKNINSLQGAENAYKVVVVELADGETKPEMDTLNSISKDAIFERVEETVRENIIRHYQQPLTLHAIKVSGQLGLSKEWEEAKINYDERTENERNKIGTEIAKLMVLWHEGDPGKNNPDAYKVVPITGFPPVLVERTLSETLLVGSLVEIRAIIESTALSPAQKIEMLVAMYPIKEEVAKKLVTPTDGNNA